MVIDMGCAQVRPLLPHNMYKFCHLVLVVGHTLVYIIGRLPALFLGHYFAEMETRKPLKSLNSNTQTYIAFVNRTSRPARAWWLDFSGNPVSYGDISPNKTLQMNTFLTHPWIFRVTENGARLTANQQEVYYPSLSEFPQYIPINITTPVYTLRECCLMAIRKFVKRQDLNKLDIPEILKHDLMTVTNLDYELEIMNRP